MNKNETKDLALSAGFKLKEQPNGEQDLNSYVYEFAAALLAPLQEANRELRAENARLLDRLTVFEIVEKLRAGEDVKNHYGFLMMSRTKAQKSAAKKLLKKPAGKFESIDLSERSSPSWMTRAFRNNRYVVMINDHARIKGIDAVKAMVQRHDDKPIQGHWRQLQNIKNELFGSDSTAIEFYPPESELEDVANIYWLWVIPNESILSV